MRLFGPLQQLHKGPKTADFALKHFALQELFQNYSALLDAKTKVCVPAIAFWLCAIVKDKSSEIYSNTETFNR